MKVANDFACGRFRLLGIDGINLGKCKLISSIRKEPVSDWWKVESLQKPINPFIALEVRSLLNAIEVFASVCTWPTLLLSPSGVHRVSFFLIFQYHSTYAPTSMELFMGLVPRMGKPANCAHFANGNKDILSTITRLEPTTHPHTLHPGCVSSRGFSAGGRLLPSFAIISTQCTHRAQVFFIQTLAD